MNAIAQGCLEFLVVWGLAAAGLHQVFSGQFEPPGDLWGAVGGGFLIASGWGLLRNLLMSLRRRRLLRRESPPVDGKECASAGNIFAIGEPLKTPFEQQECISYGYDVTQQRYISSRGLEKQQSRIEKLSLMGGYAMCPCVVRSGMRELKILGFPVPEAFPKTEFQATAIAAKIQRYIGATTFAADTGPSVTSVWKEVRDLFSEDDGSHRYDWRTASLESELRDERTKVSEQYVPNGAAVCVFGTYSQQKGGIINNFRVGVLEVLPGTRADGLKKLGRRVLSQGIGALCCFALGTAGASALLTVRELRSSRIHQLHLDRLGAAIRADDIKAAIHEIDRGASPNTATQFIDEALPYLRSEAMLQVLTKSGLDINRTLPAGETMLIAAVRRGNRQLAQWLLQAGADSARRQTGWGNRAVEYAFDARDSELFQLLRERGANGYFVPDGAGSPVSDPGNGEMEAIRQFLLAYEAADVPRLRALTDGWPEEFFSSLSRGLYRGMKQCTPSLLHGRTDGDVSTVLIRCAFASHSEQWVYTLRRLNGLWKVRRESWDEHLRWPASK